VTNREHALSVVSDLALRCLEVSLAAESQFGRQVQG